MFKQTLLFLSIITISQSLKAQNSVLDLGPRLQRDTSLSIQSDTFKFKTKRSAQNDENTGTSWISAGFGTGTLGCTSFMGTFNIMGSNKRLASLGVQGDELKNNSSLGCFNLTTGRVIKLKRSLFTLSAGVAFVDRQTPKANSTNSTDYNDQITIGIPVLLQGYFITEQHLGFGVNGYLSLNTIRTIAGFTINIAYLTLPATIRQKPITNYTL